MIDKDIRAILKADAFLKTRQKFREVKDHGEEKDEAASSNKSSSGSDRGGCLRFKSADDVV